MKKALIGIIILVSMLMISCESNTQDFIENDSQNTATSDSLPLSSKPDSSPTVKPVITPAPLPTEKPVLTPSPSAQPVVTPSPTSKPVLIPSPTPVPTTTPSPTPRPVLTPSPTPLPTPTQKPENQVIGTMPLYVGQLLSATEARKSLSEFGAKLIEIREYYSDYYEKDYVIYQNIDEGKTVKNTYLFVLEISLGPDPAHLETINDLIREKNWPQDLAPCITASIRFIIDNTSLSEEEIITKLRENIRQIRYEDIGNNQGQYDYIDILLNKDTYYEKVLIHEMLHALSYDYGSYRKLGLNLKYDFMFDSGLNEGFTDYIASKSIDFSEGATISIFPWGLENHAFISQAYSPFSNILAPMITIVGDELMEKVFFSDIENAEKAIAAIDSIYGNNFYEESMEYLSVFHYHDNSGNSKYTDQDKYSIAIKYYEKMYQALELQYEMYKNDKNKISEFSDNLYLMYMYFPFENDYFTIKLNLLTEKLNKTLVTLSLQEKVRKTGVFNVPDFNTVPIDDIGKIIHTYAYASVTSEYINYDYPHVEKDKLVKVMHKVPLTNTWLEAKPGGMIVYGAEYVIYRSLGIE
ncbi:MAG: hypothetical protein JXQ23_13390 [Clostridia bacterium]|nr:hypothetical protein [Clostridia bacterium]